MAVERKQIDQTAGKLFEELRTLHAELHPGKRLERPVGRDSSLDRDLGFDSLGRMELLQRLEARFEISLTEQLIADAVSVDELLQAVLQADRRQSIGTPAQLAENVAGTAVTAPGHARTLPEVLDWHLSSHPDRHHIRFYHDRHETEPLTFRQLHRGAVQVAAGLQQRGLAHGDPVAIMLPSDTSYFHAFWGVLLAGGVPVPIYPPTRKAQMEDHLKRQLVILGNCQATALITMPEALLFGRLLKSNLPHLRELLTVDELGKTTAAYVAVQLKESDIAFLQYTSGSTGNPKGVMLTHANLLANIRAMGKAVEVTDDDVIVSWLPLYHDMGLIGCWLSGLYYACQLVLMAPFDFLGRPARWLHAVHRHHGTLSPAPNFAYEICLTRVRDEELEGLDLSSWRCAFNGAEAVSPNSIERFCRRFARYGFRREAMMPVYGMAENSVGLSFPPPGREPLIDVIDRDVFTRSGKSVPAPPDSSNRLRFVSCGRPIPNHEIRVIDRSGHELPDRSVGQVQFRGPSACSGYYRNPEATAALFDGEWLDSGDLGYINSGEIYITGRRKDLIIIAGRNIYPQELEEAVAELPGIRRGNVAVFGSTDPKSGTERLVVLAETRETGEQERDRLRREITSLAVQLLGNPPHDIILAPPQSVPKTSSGKIRRSAARHLYDQGLLTQRRSPWRQYLALARIGLTGQLRRGWQAAGELAFAIRGWGSFYLLMPPVYLGVLLLPSFNRRWRFIRRMVHLWSRLSATPVQVRGVERLPEGPCVLVANHASYLDGYALIAALPGPFSFIAKRELAANPLVRVALQRIGTEFVERFDLQKGIEDARRLGKRAGEGRALMYFPEGTFTRVPGLRKFRLGAFTAAADAGLPVVPIAIRGTRSILRGDDKFPHRGRISIRIGPAVSGAALPESTDTESPWRKALRLRDECRDFILRHCGEPDLGQD